MRAALVRTERRAFSLIPGVGPTLGGRSARISCAIATSSLYVLGFGGSCAGGATAEATLRAEPSVGPLDLREASHDRRRPGGDLPPHDEPSEVAEMERRRPSDARPVGGASSSLGALAGSKTEWSRWASHASSSSSRASFGSGERVSQWAALSMSIKARCSSSTKAWSACRSRLCQSSAAMGSDHERPSLSESSVSFSCSCFSCR
mmetsp:Transcript_25404/g.74397  ORF Transcript_25404/g.74397 Transcript_25404/m.74397 type:complete len:205 (+) Transcript_25404:94-708(+)